jgi:hypothetical protein
MGTAGPYHGVSGQYLHIARIYDFEIHMGKKSITHQIHMIQNLHEDAILGIDFNHTHQLACRSE